MTSICNTPSFWDAKLGRLVNGSWQQHANSELADFMAFSPDGTRIVTKSGMIRARPQPRDKVAEHRLQYRNGMLQSLNKICLMIGYIKVLTTLPGLNPKTTGYARVDMEGG